MMVLTTGTTASAEGGQRTASGSPTGAVAGVASEVPKTGTTTGGLSASVAGFGARTSSLGFGAQSSGLGFGAQYSGTGGFYGSGDMSIFGPLGMHGQYGIFGPFGLFGPSGPGFGSGLGFGGFGMHDPWLLMKLYQEEKLRQAARAR